MISNAVHGSSSADDAAKELAFFFPTFTPPKAVIPQSVRAQMADDDEEDVFPAKDSAEAESVSERTVTIIRPEALKAHKEDILNEIAEAGFQIVRQKEIQLTREQAEQLYVAQKDESHYEGKGSFLYDCISCRLYGLVYGIDTMRYSMKPYQSSH